MEFIRFDASATHPTNYPRQRIRDWVQRWGELALPEPHLTFWRLVLDLPFDPLLADAAWGNLVILASGVRVGFYGYGYQMVGTLIEAEGVRYS